MLISTNRIQEKKIACQKNWSKQRECDFHNKKELSGLEEKEYAKNDLAKKILVKNIHFQYVHMFRE